MYVNKLKKIEKFIKENNLFETKNIIVAFSGGADSVCLLFSLITLQKSLTAIAPFNLYAVHINHNLREEAKEDERFAKNFCEKYGVKYSSFFVDVKKEVINKKYSIEEVARILRYEVLLKEAKRLDASIFTAHHQNDNAETVILNLSRGTGLSGLVGIEPRSKKDGVSIIRPLLCMTRKEIEIFVKENKLDFVVDKTNFDTKYKRNYVRHNVLNGLLNNVNEKTCEHIFKTGRIVKSAISYFDEVSKQVLEKGRFVKNKFEISSEILKGEHEFIRKYVIKKVYEKLMNTPCNLSSNRINAIDEILSLSNTAQVKRIEINKELVAKINNKVFILEKEEKKEVYDYEIEILNEENRKKLEKDKKIKIENKDFIIECEFTTEKTYITDDSSYTKYIDYDKIKDSVFLRKRKIGDYIYISSSKTKKLKSEFIDKKVSSDKRDEIYLLTNEDSLVYWAISIRQGANTFVKENTKNVLKITFTKKVENNGE